MEKTCIMAKPRSQYSYLAAVLLAVFCIGSAASGQTVSEYDEFGPVVRAYLGYLRNEQNVVDDRASRHEVNRDYYRRNSNRIRALRQMAVRIADESRNDYLPELEAVTVGEFRTIFDNPPAHSNVESRGGLSYHFPISRKCSKRRVVLRVCSP